MRSRDNLIKNIDWITILVYLALVIFGWINIYAAEYNEEHRSIFDFSQRYGKQMIWIIAALVIAALVFLVDIKFFSLFAYVLYGLVLLSLILVLVLGKEIHGSRSWFEIGSFHLQPSEFAKIVTALALARYMSTYNFRINRFKSIVWIFLIFLAPALLIALQPDLGSAIIFVSFVSIVYREGFSGMMLFTGVLFVGLFFLSLLVDQIFILIGLIMASWLVFWIIHRKPKQVFIALLIFAAVAASMYAINHFTSIGLSYYFILGATLIVSLPFYLGYAIRRKLEYIFVITGFMVVSILFTFSVDYVFNEVLKEHQQHRVNILLGIESDPLGLGYNVNQSKIAIGSGGFSGKGFLNGTQTKFDFVPEQSTDFIFCTVGEEWGFIGTFLVIMVFLFFFLRLIWMAERQRSSFSRIYGYGVIAVLFMHFLINIGMTIGLLPVIGIPLPFFSYGGSSLWAFTILLFIFLRLDASRKELLA
jgi:rod shape determining protein RodA